jgi:transcription antitermination factor NusG
MEMSAAAKRVYSGWHIVRVEPGREFSVVAAMTDRRFEAMCPADYYRRRTGRRDQQGRAIFSTEPTPKAFIPGYVFAKFDAEPDRDGIKAVPHVWGFQMVIVGDGQERYGVLTEAEVQDLRTADEVNFEAFRLALLPKSERKPAVEFKEGKAVRFTTKFGQEIYGLMMQKKGGSMVKVMTGHMAYTVSQFDLQEGAAA